MNLKVVFGFLTLFLSLDVSAQNAQWGAGLWGGMQSCSGSGNGGGGAMASMPEALRGSQPGVSKVNGKLKAKRKQLERLETELERARNDVEDAVTTRYADVLLTHLENNFSCEEYKGMVAGKPRVCRPDEACTTGRANISMSPYNVEEWKSICSGEGLNEGVACSRHQVRGGRTNGGACAKGLRTYATKYSQKRKLEKEIERLEREEEIQQEKMETAKEELLERGGKGPGGTEGGVCLECQKSQVNWGSVLANGLVGGLAIYSANQNQKSIQQSNAARGWTTQPMPSAVSYGFPYVMNAVYGALGSGTGQGSFGCGSGVNGTGNWNGQQGISGPFGQNSLYSMGGGGAFGYPTGMMGQVQSGGMYPQGFTSFGNYGTGLGSGPIPVTGVSTAGSSYGSGVGSGPIPVSSFSNYGAFNSYGSSSLSYGTDSRLQTNYLQEQQVMTNLSQQISLLTGRLQNANGYYGTNSYYGIGTGTGGYFTGR